MAQHDSAQPKATRSGRGNPVTSPRDMANVLAKPGSRTRGSSGSNVAPGTIEDRLEAKAAHADRTDHTGQPSLGQMTREARRKALFGE